MNICSLHYISFLKESVSITIVDDDEGGMLMFELPTKEVSGTVCVCVSCTACQTT